MNLPVLGALFRSRDYLRQETELLIIVTPYIVHAVDPQMVQRPDSGLLPMRPIRKAGCSARSTASIPSSNCDQPRADLHRQDRFHHGLNARQRLFSHSNRESHMSPHPISTGSARRRAIAVRSPRSACAALARGLQDRRRRPRPGREPRLPRALSDRARAGADDARRLHRRWHARRAVARQHPALRRPLPRVRRRPDRDPRALQPPQQPRGRRTCARRSTPTACAARSRSAPTRIRSGSDAGAVPPVVSRASWPRCRRTCGNFPDDLASGDNYHEWQNLPYENFGCATQKMLAAQIDDPRDLARARALRRFRRRDAAARASRTSARVRTPARTGRSRTPPSARSEETETCLIKPWTPCLRRSTVAAGQLPQIDPVPRVSIQVFCETPDVAGVVQSAMGDRRMRKAHVKQNMGGAAAAVEAYRTAPTPNVIVLEATSQKDAAARPTRRPRRNIATPARK